jgi:predicted membrane protein
VSEQAVVEHGQSRAGRWLARRRLQFALWIAVLEGIIVAVSASFSWIVALVIAVPVILLYLLYGRTADSDTGRQLSWIAGASQVFVILLAILFIVLKWIMIALIVVFALLALVFLYADRPGRTAKP